MDAQGTTQPGGRGRIFLLLERHAGQFGREAWIVRGTARSGEKGLPSIFQAAHLCQRAAVKEGQIRSSVGKQFEFANDFVPAIFSSQLLDSGRKWKIAVERRRGLRISAEDRRAEKESERQRADEGCSD